MKTSRTFLEREADIIDCDLARLVARLEYLEEKSPAHRRIAKARFKLDGVRSSVRVLMHPEDRETNNG